MGKTFQPAIKWSGSKRSQSSAILSHFPNKIDTYYEPFCGGCSILRTLMEDKTIDVKRYVCSDLNKDLIDLWNTIKTDPEGLANEYEWMWNWVNESEDRNIKRERFESLRDDLNKNHSPYVFMCIMRMTTNGMPRYNRKGEFNNSFHITRDGIRPDTLRKIIFEWSDLLNKNNVEFHCCSFDEIVPDSPNDFVYLDPPCANTKGMYFGNFDNTKLFDYLHHLKCGYVMSYDGVSGKIDNTYEVPEDVYDIHIYIKSGNSSFKRTIGKSNDSIVYESLYIKLPNNQ